MTARAPVRPSRPPDDQELTTHGKVVGLEMEILVHVTVELQTRTGEMLTMTWTVSDDVAESFTIGAPIEVVLRRRRR